jgi:hypothetical protein
MAFQDNNLPDYIIIQKSPLQKYSQVPDQILELVKNRYQLMKTYEAVNVSSLRNWYDQLDAFYVPFIGFQEISRPGPNLYIYQRTPN